MIGAVVWRFVVSVLVALVVGGVAFVPNLCSAGGPACAEGATTCEGSPLVCFSLLGVESDGDRALRPSPSREWLVLPSARCGQQLIGAHAR